NKLTLTGDNEFWMRFGAWEFAYGGIIEGTLVFDGGSFKSTYTGNSHLFSGYNLPPKYGSDATAIFKNGNKFTTFGNLYVGHEYNGKAIHTNDTVIITGAPTAWNMNGKNFYIRNKLNSIFVDDGAVVTNANAILFDAAENGLFKVSDGALVDTAALSIGGWHYNTFAVDNASLFCTNAANTSDIIIGSHAAHVNNALKISNGSIAKMSRNLTMSGLRGLFEVRNSQFEGATLTIGVNSVSSNSCVIADGGNTVIAENIRIGTIAGDGSTGGGFNSMTVENSASLEARGLYVGVCQHWGAYETHGQYGTTNNSFAVNGGSATFSTAMFIASNDGGAGRFTKAHDNFVRVGGESDMPGELEMNGANINIGCYNSGGANINFARNYLEAAPYGDVHGVGTLNVGDTRLVAGSSNNFVRTSGGVINCENMIVASQNGLSPVISAVAKDTGMIVVSGTATFNSGTFVRPLAEKDAPYGRFVILEADFLDAGTVAGGESSNLQFSEDTPADWRLRIFDGENGHITIYRPHPATTLIIR
ncbi:MAG: hypothetical protein FWG05_02775, partial [Kiritimatiellaeota bacterium]|nr:hypothetical protein [Kiritimatiellota bacterium]